MVTVQLVHSSQKDTWKYVPEIEARIKTFCHEYESSMNPDFLNQWLRMSFISSGPTAMVLVGLDEDECIVGHCVSLAEKWFGTNVISVVQLSVDPGTVLTKDEWAKGEMALAAFAQYHQATQIRVAARSRAAARLFTRRGFKEDKVLMTRPVEGNAGI